MMFGKLVWWTLVVAFSVVVEVYAQYSQETSTPATFLQPRNFNYHPYQLQQLQETKPTKQGPVLFPNDGPPAPRSPLIVTARPLLESIANSDRNPNPPNNSVPTQNPVPTQRIQNILNPVYPLASPTDVTLSPDVLTNVAPLSDNDIFGSPDGSINNVPEASSYNHVPYAEMLLRARLNGYGRDNRFNDYEEQTVLPPIYRTLSEHARQNVIRQKPTNQFNYQIQNLDYRNQFNQNGVESDENDKDYDQDQNYAFSYKVKDKKTGDDFSHKQESVSGGTNGEYRVRLPDGRLQIVSYTADENGYKADVRYDYGDTEDKNENIRNEYNNNQNVNNNKNHIIKNNNNLYQQYDTRGYTNLNNDYNNIIVRQYDYQNIYPTNYFIPQNNNLQPIDRVFANDYVKNDNNVIQYENSNLRNEYPNYKDSIPIKEDPNQYNSKEYYDYDTEYNNNQNYEPYNSKFAVFRPSSTPLTITTVRPTYALKPIFTVAPTKGIIYTDGVISASNNPEVKYESTTDNTVKIGGKKIYTNINHSLPTEQTTVKNIVSVTPASYLASTIASLRDRITPKPVGFGNFINRLTKYLSYK